MSTGKGGPNYWYTEGDARRACEEVLKGVVFLVTVPPAYQFRFVVGQRVVAGQWVSEDCEFIQGMIAHITLSIDRLELQPAQASTGKKPAKSKDKEESKTTYRAVLDVSNLHYTVRTKSDSQWIEQNIDQVVKDQRDKQKTQLVNTYNEIQARTLHRGLTSKTWNSGNKGNNDAAQEYLEFKKNGAKFPGDLDKVQGLVAMVGSDALKGKEFSHPSAKGKLPVESAIVNVS